MPRPAISSIEAEARARNEDRRTRVLAHPDIADDLTRRPLACSTPQQWGGFVPPAMFNGEPNDSPVREQIMTILRRVELAEREEEVT